ncbi:MAG: YicC family protein [Syntrophorhabdaceae bacterium]|nr:YicC family protein [Syntrophorhabdales bacterium]MBP9560645.1 YicC family protein [Syntrophorhabdaceae bacterium]
MIKSMTGFSRMEEEYADGRFYGEARSLNNRYMEINLRLPRTDNAFEQRLRELVKRYIKRGKVDITIKWERQNNEINYLKINEGAVRQYLDMARQLKDRFGIPGELTIENIIGLRDLFSYEENNTISGDCLFEPFEELLRRLDEERKKEGRLIEKDFLLRLKTINTKIREIEKRAPVAIKAYEMRLRERIQEIIKEGIADEMRILQEIAIYMEKMDISEEITRLRGHLKNFKDTLSADDSIGRKLDFIIQEMVRESNTIGSKSNDFYISERVVQIKVEIEKMREQVQNVE